MKQEVTEKNDDNFSDDDCIEVIEIKPINKGIKRSQHQDSNVKRAKLISSSSRSEIRSQLRGVHQSNITTFFAKSPSKSSEAEKSTLKLQDNISKTNGYSDEIVICDDSKDDFASTNNEVDNRSSVIIENINQTQRSTSVISGKQNKVPFLKNKLVSNPSSDSKNHNSQECLKDKRKSDCEKDCYEKPSVSDRLQNEVTSEMSIKALDKLFDHWKSISKKNSKDDEKIRNRILKNYHLAHTSFTHSKKFLSILESKLKELTIDNIYVLMSDLLLTLKSYKDAPYVSEKKLEIDNTNSDEKNKSEVDEELSKDERKKQWRLRKLERTMEVRIKNSLLKF